MSRAGKWGAFVGTYLGIGFLMGTIIKGVIPAMTWFAVVWSSVFWAPIVACSHIDSCPQMADWTPKWVLERMFFFEEKK